MTAGERTQRKEPLALGLSAAMILAAAILFALVGEAPQTLVLVCGGLLVSALIRRPLPRTARSWIYAIVIVLVVTVLQNELMPVDEDRFFILNGAVYTPALLYLAVACTFFDQSEVNLSAIIALTLLSLLLAGNTADLPLGGRRPASLSRLRQDFHWIFGATVLIEIVLMLFLLPRVEPRVRQKKTPWMRLLPRHLVVVACFLLAAAGAIGMRTAAFRYQNVLRSTFFRMFHRYMSQRSSVVFGRTVDLWRTVPYLKESDRRIVLRVMTTSRPGYLRGRAYPTYRQGRWTTPASYDSLPASMPEEDYTFTLFRRVLGGATADGSLGARTMEIYPAANFRSNVLMAPGTTRQLAMIADGVRNDENGVLSAYDWEEETGYRLTQAGTYEASAYPKPGGAARDRTFLQLPADIEKGLAPVLATLRERLPDSEASTRTRIRAVTSYLNQRYSYALDVDLTSREDPVLQFLYRTRRGHCELFASSTALLLRALDVPTRYITGFGCYELHPSGDYYVSRLSDAHAWVEAWDPHAGGWVLVDSTPPSQQPDGQAAFSFWSGWKDWITMLWQRVLSLIKQGYVAEAIIAVSTTLAAMVWSVLSHPLGAAAAPLVTAWALHRLVRNWRRRRRAERKLLGRTRKDLQGHFRRIERGLRRLDVSRTETTTVAELAADISATTNREGIHELLELLHRYERLRFAAAPPSEEDVRRFGRDVRRVLKNC